MNIRPATPLDIPALAQLWHETWVEAHAAHVPAALTRLRNVASFEERLSQFGDRLRMAGSSDAPLGLCVIDVNELDQLFVSPAARGSGLGATLLSDAEDRLRKTGVDDAFLYCTEGNTKAAKFYTKHGWRDTGAHSVELDTSEGPFKLECLIFRKALALPK